MQTTKALFFELMSVFQSGRGNEFELEKLSLRDLLALAKLLGGPSCGSKETVIIRFLAQRELRFKLSRFTDNPEELANSYKRESLREMWRERLFDGPVTNAAARIICHIETWDPTHGYAGLHHRVDGSSHAGGT